MDYRELDSRDRRVVILASPERALELSQHIDWKRVVTENLPFAALGALGPLGVLFGGYLLSKKLLKGKMPLLHKGQLPYPLFDLRTARDHFKFPIHHPVDGLVYVCCEAEPNHYVPLASFHRYMYEAKLAAFQELCANLGVRRCTVVYAEEDGQDVTIKVRASGIPTQIGPVSGGVSTGVSRTHSETAAIFAEYPAPYRPLTETSSGWMHGEPTWVTMQKLRLERDLERWGVEFTYASDMGINANIAAKIAGVGLEIGGQFEKMRQRKCIFDVEFWPYKAA